MNGLRKIFDSGKKVMAVWLLVNGTIWVYLSYALAWTGRITVLENLTRTIIITIFGTFATYSASSTVEHISESKRGSILSAAADTVANMQQEEANEIEDDVVYATTTSSGIVENTINESEATI